MKIILVVVGLIALYAIAGPKSTPTTSAPGTTVPIAAGGTPPATSPAAATPAPTPAPTPSPVVIRGTGQTATDPFTLPAPNSVAAFTHTGRSNFAVWTFVGGQRKDLLVNTIGNYTGSRPLRSTTPMQLSIEADGPWTATITAIACCASSGEFAGRGDSVSNQFNPPGAGTTWAFTNNGTSNFAVWARCAGGDNLLQNRIGPFEGTTIVVFSRGPCYWDVVSNGEWSIRPR